MNSTWKTISSIAVAITLLAGLTTTPARAADETKKEAEKLPAGIQLVRIEVFPPSIELRTPFDYRQVLLTGITDKGERIDVTRIARLEASEPVVNVTDRRLVTPVKNGAGTLRFSVAGLTAAIPVTVSGQDEPYNVSFVRDVMPVLSKAGCNAGTCHGAAKGKNGFRLSLRGYDPVFDHRALTDDVLARRIDRSAPDRSLMLLKATNEVPHVGGMRMKTGDRYYKLLHAWIAQGVQLDKDSPRVKSIEVIPESATIPLPGMKQQIVVIATYTDGSRKDVTAEAHLKSSNNEVAKADDAGVVTAIRRGETAVLARYEGAYAAAPLVVMGDRSGFVWQQPPTYNYIDELVYKKLKKVKILPSGVCTDEEFIRRVYLDLTGLPPTPEKVLAFLNDPRPSREKREALVDELIGSKDYLDYWTNKWADLLQVNSKYLGVEGARKYRDWIRSALEKNMPYNEFAYRILTATGSNIDNPPAAYWKIHHKPTEAMENTTHLFLAIRFNCNKCHDHPFERWTQDNYYHLGAYFAQVGLKPDPRFKGKKIGGTAVEGARPLVEIIFDKKSGEITHDRTGQVAEPQFPFTHGGMPPAQGTRREQLAKWITAAENPYFAKSYVNRVWSYLMGVGLIEPVDDIRAGNPPTNPELLDRMTQEFIASGFDTRKLIRTICTSRTYQHSVETNKWNADDKLHYSHALARRLPAEVLYDAIHRALDVPTRIPGMPVGARAVEIVDANIKLPGGFLKVLGRPPRESACECERTNSVQLGPVLALINGPVISEALRDPNNRVAKLLAKYKNDNRKVVEGLFLGILSRRPTDREIQLGVDLIEKAKADHRAMVEERQRREKALRDYEAELNRKQIEWEARMKTAAKWVTLEPSSMKATGAKLTKEKDLSIFATGKNPTPETYIIELPTKLQGITGIRLEVLPDKRLPARGPGRAKNGNFVLTDFKVYAVAADGKGEKKYIPFSRALADFSQRGFDVARAIDQNPTSGWAIAPQLGKRHVAVFEFAAPVGSEKGTKLIVKMEQRFKGKEHNIGKFRLSVTTAPRPLKLELLPGNIARLLQIPAEKRNAQQKAQLRDFYRRGDERLAQLQQQLNEYIVPADPRAIGAQDLAWALLNSRAFLFNH